MRVSFDYDGSLDRESLQKYAKELVDRGFEVWIITRRYSNIDDYSKEFCKKYKIVDLINEHKQLFVVANECGIKSENIHFMNMIDKFWFFKKNSDFLWHLDDDSSECDDINKFTKTIAISCANGSNWKNKCERLIQNKLNEK